MKQLIKILIVEDDNTIASVLKKNLEQWNFNVRCAKKFNNILEEFEDYKPSLVIMDIGLPAFNGYHWCSEIRNKSQVPIIFLSSRNDKMDIVMAMQMGGEDFAWYLEKVPGSFIFLATPSPIEGKVWPHHNPKFALDESQFYRGTALFAAYVIKELGK